MTAEQTAAERYTERIEAQVDELVRMIAATTDTHWFHRPGPEEWTAAEVCGHIAEMLPYWAKQAQVIAANPGMTYGRAMDDPDRVGGVRSGATLSRQDAVERVRAATHEAVRALRSLPAAGWHAEAIHIERGTETVANLIEYALARHLETHVEQVRHALGGPAHREQSG
jgi:hypothetical protein